MTRENKTLLYLMHYYFGFQSHVAEPEARYGHVAESEGRYGHVVELEGRYGHVAEPERRRYGHSLLCEHLIYTYQYCKRQDCEEARSLT